MEFNLFNIYKKGLFLNRYDIYKNGKLAYLAKIKFGNSQILLNVLNSQDHPVIIKSESIFGSELSGSKNGKYLFSMKKGKGVLKTNFAVIADQDILRIDGSI